MIAEARVFPFRWALPIAQLLLCAVILWPMRPMFMNQLRTSLRAYGVSHDSAEKSGMMRRPVIPFDFSDPEVQKRIKDAESREWMVATLNLPGGLPELLYAVVSPAHAEWMPEGMLMWTWRDLSWPIVGMFFWWLAGLSIEALLFARHKILRPIVKWWELAVAVPVLAYGGMWAIIMFFDRSARTEFPRWMPLGVFGVMWFVLGMSTVAAWIVQWRLRKRFASGVVEVAAPLASGS
jgi:hypothetical protein